MSYVIQRVIGELLLPPFSPFFLLLFAMLLIRNRPRSGWAVAAMAITLFLSTSVEGLYTTRQRAQTISLPDVVRPPYPEADAIVVLGGGRYLNAREYAGDTAGPSTLERVRYAAKLFRETGKPLLVTGGKPGGFGQTAEGDIMRSILEQEFKVPVKWVENEAQETKSNATYSARILLPLGIKRVYLVTHGTHMERAKAEFTRAGFDAIPMITGFVGPEPQTIFNWTPSFQGIAVNRAILYEWLAKLKPF